MLPGLPYRLARLLGELERGELMFTAHHEGLEEGVRELERASHRVTMGLITAALIVGSAVAVTYYHPPAWEAVGGVIFTLTFVMAAVFAARLLWIIWRTGRC